MLDRKQSGPDRSCLVTVQQGNEGPRLFFVHAIGGGVAYYAQLAHALGPDYALYGLQAFWMSDGRPALQSIEEMARYYVDQLRSLGREAGPFHIYGWSLGGLIAFEMARLLTATERGLIAVGDTRFEEAATDPGYEQALERRFWQTYASVALGGRGAAVIEGGTRDFWQLGDAKKLAVIADAAVREGDPRFRAHVALRSVQSHYECFVGLWRAARRYRASPNHGQFLFFASTEGAADARGAKWAALVEKCDVVGVAGDHLGIMQPPGVRRIADELRLRLVGSRSHPRLSSCPAPWSDAGRPRTNGRSTC